MKSRFSRGKTRKYLKKRQTRKNKKGGSPMMTKSRIQKIVNLWFRDNRMFDKDERDDYFDDEDVERMTRNAQRNNLKNNEEVYNEINKYVKRSGKLAD